MAPSPRIPDHVSPVLAALWAGGHAAYLVGGSLRDELLGRAATDWDVATDAPPERIQALFPGSHYENRFGTVLVPAPPGGHVEVTTFRRDHDYGDRRRPDRVDFGDSLVDDLARRDFTVNAIAFGRPGDKAATPDATGSGPRRRAGSARPLPARSPARSRAGSHSGLSLVDPLGGLADQRMRSARPPRLAVAAIGLSRADAKRS